MPHIIRQLARIASARDKGGVGDREYCVDFIGYLGKSVFALAIVAWRNCCGVALYAALSVGNVMAFTLRYAGDRYASGRPVSAATRLSIARQLPPRDRVAWGRGGTLVVEQMHQIDALHARLLNRRRSHARVYEFRPPCYERRPYCSQLNQSE